MVDPLLFGRLADARRARPRHFRLFNAYLDEYLSENDVKSRFRFGRDSINYLADLLSDELALSGMLFGVHGRLPFDQNFRDEFPKNFHGQMVQSFSSVEDDNCSF